MKYIKQKKMEFCKKIYLYNLTFVLFTTIMGFICVINSGRWGITDLSPISTIISVAFVELGVHTAGYQLKAKSENVIKISQSIKEKEIDRESIEIANQIVNSQQGGF